MTQDKNGDDGGRTLMFNPSESEEFRKAMDKERALQDQSKEPEEDDASPKTMMFSPGQVNDALKKQTADLAQEKEPTPLEEDNASPKTMMFSPGQVSDALKKQAANLTQEQEPTEDEEIQSAKTMAFSVNDVAEHVKRLKEQAASGDSGSTPEKSGTTTSPNLPAAGSSTLSYSKDEVDKLRQNMEKKKSDGGEDLGTAQTMMYSVEDSHRLKEAMAMLDQNKGTDAQARDKAQELLREARQTADTGDNFQPSNPFAAAPPEPEDTGEFGTQTTEPAPMTRPSSPKAQSGRPPRPKGRRPGPAGPPPKRPVPSGTPTAAPSLPYGDPSATTSSLTEQALSGASKKGGALKVVGILVGVALVGAVVAGLLHAFAIVDLPFDFLPRF